MINQWISSREERIRNGSKKLAKARTATQQGRLDSFFKVTRKVTTTTTSPKKPEAPPPPKITGLKRKTTTTSQTKTKGRPAKKPKTE